MVKFENRWRNLYMSAEKRILFDASGELDKNPDYSWLYSSLDSSKVERGKVIEQKLLETCKVKVSFLYVSPGGKISEHFHTADREIYIFPVLEKMEECRKGQSHCLKNKSNKPLFVISLKYDFESKKSVDKLYCKEQYENIISTLKSGEAKQLLIYEDANIQVYMFVFYPGTELIPPKKEDDGWSFFLEDFRIEGWNELFHVRPSKKTLYVLGLKYKSK